MFYTYILFSQKIGKHYIGSTADLQRRLLEHNRGKSAFAKSGMPWALVYFETFETRQEALQRENYIKKQKSTLFIKSLVEKFSSAGSEHPDL